MTLVEFLLARIAEDEAAAQDASVRRYDFLDFAGHVLASERDATPAMDEHVDRWEPSRVLAECEAKRRIVELHGGDYDGECQSPAHLDGPCRTLRALALPYADHPDYDEEWKP